MESNVLQRLGLDALAGTRRWKDGFVFCRPLGAVLLSSEVGGARSGDSVSSCRVVAV